MEKRNRTKTVLRVVLICLFFALIATTVGVTVHEAVESYRYDMDPANGVDLLEGFAAAFALMIGGFIVVCELDLFYVSFYVLTQKKSVLKTVLNVLCPLLLLSIYALFVWQYDLPRWMHDLGAFLVVFFLLLHGLLRLSYLAVCLADGAPKISAIPAGD